MRLPFLIFLCLVGLDSLAQVTLSGRIIEVNSGNKGLSGVQITSPFSKDTIRTDSTGQFEVSCNTSVGEALKSLQVRKEGYIVDNEGVFFQYDRTSGISIYMYDFAARKRFENQLHNDLKKVLYHAVKDSIANSADTLVVRSLLMSFSTLPDMARMLSYINYDLYDSKLSIVIQLLRVGDLEATKSLIDNWETAMELESTVKQIVCSLLAVTDFTNVASFSEKKLYSFTQYQTLLGREAFLLPLQETKSHAYSLVSSYDYFQERFHESVKKARLARLETESQKELEELFDWLEKLQEGNNHLLLDEVDLYTLMPRYNTLKTSFSNQRSYHLSEVTTAKVEKYLPILATYHKLILLNNKWTYLDSFRSDSTYFEFYDKHEKHYGLNFQKESLLIENYFYLRTPKSQELLHTYLANGPKCPPIGHLYYLNACHNLLPEAHLFQNDQVVNRYLKTYHQLLESVHPFQKEFISDYELNALLHQAHRAIINDDFILVKETYGRFERKLLTVGNSAGIRLNILEDRLLEDYFRFSLLNFKSKRDIERHTAIGSLIPESFFKSGYQRWKLKPDFFDHTKSHFIVLINLNEKLENTENLEVAGELRELMLPHWAHLASDYQYSAFQEGRITNIVELGRAQLFYDTDKALATFNSLYDELYNYKNDAANQSILVNRLNFHIAVCLEVLRKPIKVSLKLKQVSERFSDNAELRNLALQDLQVLFKMGLDKSQVPRVMQLFQ